MKSCISIITINPKIKQPMNLLLFNRKNEQKPSLAVFFYHNNVKLYVEKEIAS
jgi:hypothetical protein